MVGREMRREGGRGKEWMVVRREMCMVGSVDLIITYLSLLSTLTMPMLLSCVDTSHYRVVDCRL